ncbi:MAG: ATP-binding cassette domain-containing protein [Cyanothece sp. SIO2G6]|nr:ATP-binding cassette domain-containing protein [Cyanothece sp. SIO2G6]
MRSPSASPVSSHEDNRSSSHAVSVLRDINLTVRDGEFMVLVGPSGCGKSTLLRLIAGLETVTAGTIQVGDRTVNDLPPKQRDIAMVFQNYALYPHMTVYDNLAFGLRRIGQYLAGVESPLDLETSSKTELSLEPALTQAWRRRGEAVVVALTRSLPPQLRYLSEQEKVIDQRVRTVAQMLQIEELLDRLPRQLSGGQKQRVALGRAMARNPQVFLMDEPLSNLDAKLRLETRAQIVSLQRRLGITTIYVTHDQTEAMTMGDRIAIMNAGQIQQIATPLDLYNAPANRFVAEFIGSLPMNFLTVQVSNQRLITHSAFRLSLPDEWAEKLRNYEGRYSNRSGIAPSLLLGIRPEHLQVGVPAPKNIATVVERIETLGSDTYITARLTETDVLNPVVLQARIQPDYAVSLRDEMWFSIPPDKIHLFDPTTTQAL